MNGQQARLEVHPARQFSTAVLHDFLQGIRLLGEPQRAALRNLVEFWGSIGDLSRLPRREDFEPQQILNILPNVFMFDVLADNALRYRLVGSTLVDHLPYDPTGKVITADEMHECIVGSAKVARDIVHYQRPVVARGRIAKDEYLSWDIMATAMPLGDEAGNTSVVFGVAFVLTTPSFASTAVIEHELL